MARKKIVVKKTKEIINKNTGRKVWIRGVDIPDFSNKSWKELDDIWPMDQRVKSDAWQLMGLFLPAVVLTKKFAKTNFNIKLDLRSIMILAYIMRCEEAKINVATEMYPIARGMDITKLLAATRIGPTLIKGGLVETFPSNKARLYRTTETGRILLRQMIENIEKAHTDLLQWIEEQPDVNASRVSEFLLDYCFKFA